MSKVHKRTSSVQHICCPPTTIRENGPKQAIHNVHMHAVSSEQRKKCGWYCTTIKFDLPLEKTREMVLVEWQLTLFSGVNIRLGGFHYLLSDRYNYGADAHVFVKNSRWCHPCAWHISVKSG